LIRVWGQLLYCFVSPAWGGLNILTIF